MKSFGKYTYKLNAAVRVRNILQDKLLQDFSFHSAFIFNKKLKKYSL